jgi:hypothetical protein
MSEPVTHILVLLDHIAQASLARLVSDGDIVMQIQLTRVAEAAEAAKLRVNVQGVEPPLVEPIITELDAFHRMILDQSRVGGFDGIAQSLTALPGNPTTGSKSF